MPAWLPLRRSWTIGAVVVSHGFSKKYSQARFPHGHPMDPSHISGDAEVVWNDVRSVVLRLTASNADAGFSGGPVVEAESGEVVGVLRFRLPSEGGTYAIPSATVLDMWPEIENVGHRVVGQPVASSPFSGSWLYFDPSMLHSVVVNSETLGDPLAHLSRPVRSLLAGPIRQDVWQAFRTYWDVRRLLRDGSGRALRERPTTDDLRLAYFNVTDAYASVRSWRRRSGSWSRPMSPSSTSPVSSRAHVASSPDSVR